jgi:predicted DNA-binding transcriptional regulator AlpA
MILMTYTMVKKNEKSEDIMERRLLTAKEVATILRTSPGQLANLRMRGEGPSHLKFSRRVLYESKAIEEWLDRHKVKTVEG